MRVDNFLGIFSIGWELSVVLMRLKFQEIFVLKQGFRSSWFGPLLLLLFPWRKLHIRSAWVGLNDKGYENVFRWDGSNFPGFKKWCPHEPNNYRYGEDCVELLGPNNYKCLNDLPCTRVLPYICEVNRRYYKWFIGLKCQC